MRVSVEADGGSRGNPGPAGYGAVVFSQDGEVLAERAAGIGLTTNNVAEYSGLIAGLQAALEVGATEVDVRMDSKLVIEQVSGRWQVKHPGLRPLAREATELLSRFSSFTATWIPRERNKYADRLANEAMDAVARGHVWKPGGDTGPADAADRWLEAQQPAKLVGWQDMGSKPTTTHLLRHGQTPLSIEKRFSGVGDPALTDVGLAQAAAAAETFRESSAVAVVSSPLRRAQQTAAAVAAVLGVEVETEPGFQETDFGDWEGYTFGEVREKWPAEMDAWLSSTAVAPPHGESFDATAVRVRQARDRLIASYGGSTVVVVSHVTPIKTMLRMALDAPAASIYRMHLDLACRSTVQWFADGPAVVRSMNETHYLAAVAPGE
ncbi:MAG: ribonuclease / adenosylcobalamin/alpha-ribazole phosphatase [Frankiales bacterium]|nr:ribonuclease / adenosylcobalamin/alpha-ribazole phosphatase [Frankiales bacterium]